MPGVSRITGITWITWITRVTTVGLARPTQQPVAHHGAQILALFGDGVLIIPRKPADPLSALVVLISIGGRCAEGDPSAARVVQEDSHVRDGRPCLRQFVVVPAPETRSRGTAALDMRAPLTGTVLSGPLRRTAFEGSG